MNRAPKILQLLVLSLTLATPALSDTATDLYDSGNVKQSKGDIDGAVADYTKAIQLKPDFVFAYYNRGIAKEAKGDLDGAIVDFSKTIELKPDLAIAYNNRGYAKKGKGDLDGAIADFSKAIDLQPDLVLAYDNRGRARQSKGDIDGATADYTKVMQLKKGSPPPAAVQPVTIAANVQPAFFPAIDKIVLLPVVDTRGCRADLAQDFDVRSILRKECEASKSKVDLKSMRDFAQKILERKQYAVTQADTPAPEARWVMVISLTSILSTAKVPAASVDGSLTDKESGKVIWKGSGMGAYRFSHVAKTPFEVAEQETGQISPSEMAGDMADISTLFLMPGSARMSAVSDALFNLLSRIPNMPKKKKN